MTQNRAEGRIFLLLTIVVSMILMIVPLPDAIRPFRPEWVLMTLLYWAMALPERVGIGFAWVVGLLMDVMLGGALGILAFSYALVIYLILNFHLQLRQYPLWQQALIVMSLALLVSIIKVIFSPAVASWAIWGPALTSTLIWPCTSMLYYVKLDAFLV
ncbi:MAG: rod shape-determining protein MreD [Gammaproteobacteria bacterium]|nr:rod shape-determining protein MreD [Gammaproteobacteria bacterium]